MPVTVQQNCSTKFKPSFAPSTNVQLCLRADGDSVPSVIDPFGFAVPAGVPTPDTAPTVAATAAAGGSMNAGKWVAYAYVWAASRRFPFVEGDSVGGNLYPRGNPSPASAPVQISNGGCDVTFALPDNLSPVGNTGWTRSDLDRVWIFRTIDFDTQALCDTAASAGDFYYVDFVEVPVGTGPGQTATYTDKFQTPTDDIAEYDNYVAPQFQFCIYADPYWWGFGNFPVRVKATWDAQGTVTMDPADPNAGYTDGRFQQACYLTPLDPDGATTTQNRQYYVYPVGSYFQISLRLDPDGTPTDNTFQAGSGYLVYNAPATTLYRSKYRNPLAWGQTETVGDIRVPTQFVFKVGGGVGTGIAQVPNMPLLVLSTKGPAATYVLDLRLAGEANFGGSLRTVSTVYSVTSQFTQFPAMMPDGSMVLYGWDQENGAIIATDGQTVRPVSDPFLTLTLRRMSDDPNLVRRAHGLYDPGTQHNCLWLPQANPSGTMNTLLSQSSVTGFWHTQWEGDVSCSAIVEGTWCSLRKVYLGTERGYFGVGLDKTKSRNWLYDQFQATGIVQAVSANTVTLEIALPSDAPGIIGNWLLVIDVHGGGDIWLRISNLDADGKTVTFDQIYSPGNAITTSFGADYTNTQNVNRYYLGLIETTLLRFFDFQAFMEDKQINELFVSLSGDDPNNPPFIQFIRDRGPAVLGQGQGYFVITNNGQQSTVIPLSQIKFDDNVTSQQWFTETPPTERIKVFGLRLVDRGYGQFRVYGWGGKMANG